MKPTPYNPVQKVKVTRVRPVEVGLGEVRRNEKGRVLRNSTKKGSEVKTFITVDIRCFDTGEAMNQFVFLIGQKRRLNLDFLKRRKIELTYT